MAALLQRAGISSRSSLLAPVTSRRVASFQPVAVRPSGDRRSGHRQLGQLQVVAVAEQQQQSQPEPEIAEEEVEDDVEYLPPGYHWYETMLILKTTLSDEERDRELAKFEVFLNKEECLEISALVRGRSALAYPIKKMYEGIYVLYNYAAKRQTARVIQSLLSNPESGSEDNVFRHITFCKS